MLIPLAKIDRAILLIRGKKVMLDTDLAIIYGVKTFRLNEQVKRNKGRFPKDFMFQLTNEEKQKVIANCDHLNKLNCRRDDIPLLLFAVINLFHKIPFSIPKLPHP